MTARGSWSRDEPVTSHADLVAMDAVSATTSGVAGGVYSELIHRSIGATGVQYIGSHWHPGNLTSLLSVLVCLFPVAKGAKVVTYLFFW